MPAEVAGLYAEANSITGLSPRGSAALLRLAVEHLVSDLKGVGKNLDERIQDLHVRLGLRTEMLDALHTVRVIGNEAVHPGVMDLKDDHDTALLLFEILNSITEELIARPKRASELYMKIPPNKRAELERRKAATKAP